MQARSHTCTKGKHTYIDMHAQRKNTGRQAEQHKQAGTITYRQGCTYTGVYACTYKKACAYVQEHT